MSEAYQSDISFLKLTLALAKKGLGRTNPNPMVGAVIVQNHKIIGEGYHKKAGLPHAEIEALRSAKTSVKGATLYLNLEPCSHCGRTPPCVDAIVQSGVKRVVCSALDPNPKVGGQGVEILRKRKVEVSVGLLEKEARALNEAFFTFHEKSRPFIAVKFASSLDGRIATRSGDSKWITNERARAYARLLRAQYQAVLVGINTVLKDDPHLGVRMKGKRDPLRIILDSTLKIPLQSKVLRDTSVIIATTNYANQRKKKILKQKGFTILSFKGKRVPLIKLLDELKKRGIISILVEGGGETIGSFIDKDLFDKVYAFYAPILIGGFKTIQDATSLKKLSFKRFADNYLVIGLVSHLSQSS